MLSLLFFLLSSLGCVIAANLIRNDPTKIVDIVHANIQLLRAPYLSDILVFTQLVYTLIMVNIESIKEMMLIMGIIHVFRILCFTSTVLPPLKNYHDKIRIFGINGNGTEYIFSGHSCFEIISSIYLYTNQIIGFTPLFIYSITTQFLIIATQNHYTVDIVLAIIISFLVYSNVFLCRYNYTCKAVLEQVL